MLIEAPFPDPEVLALILPPFVMARAPASTISGPALVSCPESS
jgi:hypothetical protein